MRDDRDSIRRERILGLVVLGMLIIGLEVALVGYFVAESYQ